MARCWSAGTERNRLLLTQHPALASAGRQRPGTRGHGWEHLMTCTRISVSLLGPLSSTGAGQRLKERKAKFIFFERGKRKIESQEETSLIAALSTSSDS